MSTANKLLLLGGILSSALALLHIIIIFIGAPAYRYFGAGEKMAQLAERGSPVPALITLLVVIIFSIFALYAFSGSGSLRPLPLLRIALVVIGAIYILRGLQIIPQLIILIQAKTPIPPKGIVFSLVSLFIGLLYLFGTIANWKILKGILKN